MPEVRQTRLFSSLILVVLLITAALVFLAIPKTYWSTDTVKAMPRSDRPASPLLRVGQGPIPPQRCAACPPPILRHIYVPAIELTEARTAEIVLNSRSANPIEVTRLFTLKRVNK